MGDFWLYNKIVENYVAELQKTSDSFEEDIMLLYRIYTISRAYVENTREKIAQYQTLYSEGHYTKGISIDQAIQLSKKFLKTIDPSYEEQFIDACNQGIIEFHTTNELKKLIPTKENFYVFSSLAGIFKEKYVVNIVLNHTMKDVFTIVHEFSHYLSMQSTDVKTNDWLHLTEGYAFLFEKLLYQYLQENKRWRMEASYYEIELMYGLSLRNYKFQREYLFLSIFLEHGSITPQKIYKYLKGEDERQQVTSTIQQLRNSLEVFLLEKSSLKDYLEDSRYVFALPFGLVALENYSIHQKEILQDLISLESKTCKEYFENYHLEEQMQYQKLFSYQANRGTIDGKI